MSERPSPPRAPPPIRPFRPGPVRTRLAPTPDAAPPRRSFLSRLWPFKPRPQAPLDIGPQDPARGLAAAKRVVTEGVLEARYKPAALRITLAIIAAPVAIYTSYELFQRRFNGKEQKQWGPKVEKTDDSTPSEEGTA